jgi:hypothetical protein
MRKGINTFTHSRIYGSTTRQREQAVAAKSEEKVSTILTGLFKTKPILQRRRINVSSVLTRDYEEKTRFASESKQTQTNPISGKANAKMGKVYFSLRRTPPTFVREGLPLLGTANGPERWKMAA